MRRITLLFAIAYTAVAQMTFTDNWEKRTILPDMFRGWQRNDEALNVACSWNVIVDSIRELKQIYKRQNELTNSIARCTSTERPVYTKEG